MDEINGITEAELVAALFSAQATGTGEAVGALTTRVLTEKVGRSKRWIRERLRKLIDKGRVESITVQVVDIAGRTTTSPAYRLRAGDDKRSGADV